MSIDERLEIVLKKLDPKFREKRTNEQLYGNSLDPNAFKGAAWMLIGINRDVRRAEEMVVLYEKELGDELSESASEDDKEIYRQQKRRLILQRDSTAEMRRTRLIWLQEVEELQIELREMGEIAALKAPIEQ